MIKTPKYLFCLAVMCMTFCLENSCKASEDDYTSEPVLHPHKALIESTRKDIVEIFATVVSSPLPRSQSKFGGVPFLPKTIAYPVTVAGDPLHFLAQLNFEEMPSLEPFPPKGLLQIYIRNTPECGAFGDPDGFRILYIPEIDVDVEQHDLFGFAAPDRYFPVKNGKEMSLQFRKCSMLMPPEDYRFKSTFGSVLEDADQGEGFRERYGDWYVEGGGTACLSHWIGGYPAFDQNRDSRTAMEGKDILLFHMGSDHPENLNWGDGGQSNFFISEEKLRALDFSDVKYSWGAS